LCHTSLLPAALATSATLAASLTAFATSRTTFATSIVRQELLPLLIGIHIPAPTAGPNLRERRRADAKCQNHRSYQPLHLFKNACTFQKTNEPMCADSHIRSFLEC